MRIAICISGYLRKYNELYYNFQKNILQPILDSGHTYDIFISTYNQLNSSSTFSFKEGLHDNYNEFNIENIISLYNPLGITVNDFDSIKDIFNIKRYYNNIDLTSLLPNIHNDGILFGLSMHYQRYLANCLKSIHEETHKFKYDLVIITRADLFWLKPININSLNNDKIYCRSIGYDYFFISNSQKIDMISGIWDNINRICNECELKEFNGFPVFCPEFFLEHHLYMNKLDILREGIGDDSCLIYPRRYFSQLVYIVLDKYNRLNEFPNIFRDNHLIP